MKNIFTSHPRKARREAFLEELNTLESEFIDELIRLADKYGKDRDETVCIMAYVMSETAAVTTFKNYEVKPK